MSASSALKFDLVDVRHVTTHMQIANSIRCNLALWCMLSSGRAPLGPTNWGGFICFRNVRIADRRDDALGQKSGVRLSNAWGLAISTIRYTLLKLAKTPRRTVTLTLLVRELLEPPLCPTGLTLGSSIQSTRPWLLQVSLPPDWPQPDLQPPTQSDI